jgi:hypothetical protein
MRWFSGRDAYHSPPSSTEVKSGLQLYLLSLQASTWLAVGLLCRLYITMGWDYVSELLPLTDILFIPGWYMSVENDSGMILTGQNRRTQRKTCPSATSSTANPTSTDQGANSELRGERPVTNRLSHSTAQWDWFTSWDDFVGEVSAVTGWETLL